MLRALWNAKAGFATGLRQRLSVQQRQMFDQTYGANAIGLLVFPELLLRSG